MNTKAIFTIAIGDNYIDMWKKYCQSNWEAYGEKHGYDIVLIDKPVKKLHDYSRRPPHWQKMFVLSHPEAAKYKDIVFLDADILINYHRAPCIVEANSSDKIGMTEIDHYLDDDLNAFFIGIRKGNFLTYEKRATMLQNGSGPMRLPTADFSKCYDNYMAGSTHMPRLNSGVMVMKPAVHKELLENIYETSFQEADDKWVNGTELVNDQTYVSFKLLQKDMVNILDPRFNLIASFEHAIHYPFTFIYGGENLLRMCFTTMLCNSYFLHFARASGMMKYAVINDEKDFAIVGLKNVFATDIAEVKHRRGTRIFKP